MVESPICKPSSYYIVANWNDWAFENMANDEAMPGRWISKVTLQHENGVFTIVRNKDWGQVFYPEIDDEGDPSKEILGPDDANQGRCWMIRNSKGITLRIQFERTYGFRKDDRKLSWQVVKAQTEKSMQAQESPPPARDVNGTKSLEPTIVPGPTGQEGGLEPAASQESAQLAEPTKPVEAPTLPKNCPRD